MTTHEAITSAAVAALPLVVAWVGAAARRLLAQRLYASHVQTIALRARAVASDLQRTVDDAKHPERPGEWTPALAENVRAEAVRRVRALEPLACQVVAEALGGDRLALDDLIGTHVEEAVRAMRAASPAMIAAPLSPIA